MQPQNVAANFSLRVFFVFSALQTQAKACGYQNSTFARASIDTIRFFAPLRMTITLLFSLPNSLRADGMRLLCISSGKQVQPFPILKYPFISQNLANRPGDFGQCKSKLHIDLTLTIQYPHILYGI